MHTPLVPQTDRVSTSDQISKVTALDIIRGWTIPKARDFTSQGWYAGYVILAVDVALIAGGVYLYKRWTRQ